MTVTSSQLDAHPLGLGLVGPIHPALRAVDHKGNVNGPHTVHRRGECGRRARARAAAGFSRRRASRAAAYSEEEAPAVSHPRVIKPEMEPIAEEAPVANRHSRARRTQRGMDV